MRVAYRCRQARCAGTAAEAAVRGELSRAAGRGELDAILDALDARMGRFAPAEVFDGSVDMALDDSDAYQRWLTAFVRRDLAEAAVAPSSSPLKAALSVFEDLRETIRYAVDHGGLTDRSLDRFTCGIVPRMNRAVVGPHAERYRELLALMASGIVEAPFGPAPRPVCGGRARRWTISSTRLRAPHSREADWIVRAHVRLPAVDSSASPLVSALYGKGAIRRHRHGSRHVHCIDIDVDQHPLDARGWPDRRLWVLGPLCEGATYYNNLVPATGYSRLMADAHRCVSELLRSP